MKYFLIILFFLLTIVAPWLVGYKLFAFSFITDTLGDDIASYLLGVSTFSGLSIFWILREGPAARGSVVKLCSFQHAWLIAMGAACITASGAMYELGIFSPYSLLVGAVAVIAVMLGLFEGPSHGWSYDYCGFSRFEN